MAFYLRFLKIMHGHFIIVDFLFPIHIKDRHYFLVNYFDLAMNFNDGLLTNFHFNAPFKSIEL
jgi:hypothetical protein